MGKTIDDMLAEIQVHYPGMWENDIGPKEWFAISDNDGIFAYVNKERLAFKFRLDIINERLNSYPNERETSPT